MLLGREHFFSPFKKSATLSLASPTLLSFFSFAAER